MNSIRPVWTPRQPPPPPTAYTPGEVKSSAVTGVPTMTGMLAAL